MDSSDEIIQRYRNQIRPIFEMLKYKQRWMDRVDWKNFVHRTERSIIESPHQYLSDPPKREILELGVHRMFEEFLIELKGTTGSETI